jgi:hypothetical protein
MFIVREVMQCKPGKVRDLVKKFKGVSGVMQKMGLKGFRISTDVVGARFWTVVAETEVESLDEFFDMEKSVMANEEAGKVMAGYHDLVDSGRREIYRVEG